MSHQLVDPDNCKQRNARIPPIQCGTELWGSLCGTDCAVRMPDTVRNRPYRPANVSACTPVAIRSLTLRVAVVVLTAFLTGCLGVRGFTEISSSPYPNIYEDDSTARFGTPDDNVFIEVRKTDTSRPLEHLAVHYQSLFPGGEIIRPGDREEYVKVNGKNAFKVVFRRKYIRKRKRLDSKAKTDPESIPEGWTLAEMEDPETGKTVRVLHGPVIPQEKILYLVQSDPHIYYVLLRADGDVIESAKKKFEKFVHKDINYL